MKKLVICEKCHQGKPKEDMEVITHRVNKMTQVKYYCKDCAAIMMENCRRAKQWERESKRRTQ